MKRLYLSREDKKIMGVCGGISEYLEIDSTVVRLVFALLVLFPPNIGIILYIVASLVIPEKP